VKSEEGLGVWEKGGVRGWDRGDGFVGVCVVCNGCFVWLVCVVLFCPFFFSSFFSFVSSFLRLR